MAEENAGNLKETLGGAVEAAKETARHPLTRGFARWGFYTKGFLFIIIGILALMVTIGEEEGKITASAGAIATIAQLPYGRVILMLLIVGAVGHGVWNILRGVADIDGAGKGVKGIVLRAVAAGVGFFYIGLSYAALNVLLTSESLYSDDMIPKTLTAIILAFPLGWIAMVLVGLVVIGVGFHECYSGFTGKFKKNFRLYEAERSDQKFIAVLGALSFTARALIFVLMGYFFIVAAIYYNPDEAVGMDGALRALARSYYGKTLLFVTASGLVGHGILSLYEARYRRLC